MSKKFIGLLLFIGALLAGTANAQGMGAPGEPFTRVKYYAFGGTGSGDSASNPAASVDGDVFALPLGVKIDQVCVIVDTAITGHTDIDVGDDDDADGYVDGSLSLTLGTPGLYSCNAKLAGAYLRVQTAGATDAADIYVVPTSKFYAAAGKELKLDVTTAITAGAYRVVVKGFHFGR